MYGKIEQFSSLDKGKVLHIANVLKNIEIFSTWSTLPEASYEKHIREYLDSNDILDYFSDLAIQLLTKGLVNVTISRNTRHSNNLRIEIWLKSDHIEVYNENNRPIELHHKYLYWTSDRITNRSRTNRFNIVPINAAISRFRQDGIVKKDIDIYEKRERKKKAKYDSCNYKRNWYNKSKHFAFSTSKVDIDERNMFNGNKSMLRAKERSKKRY